MINADIYCSITVAVNQN